MKLIKKFKKFQTKILTIALAANLLVATGSAELNLASNSAQIAPSPFPSTIASPLLQNNITDEVEEPVSKRIDASGKHVKDRLSVRFKGEVTDEQKREIAKSYGAKVVREDLNLNGAKALKVKAEERDQIMNVLKNDPRVEKVELDPVGWINNGGSEWGLGPVGGGGGGSSCSNPDDPDYCVLGRQWGLGKISAPSGWGLSHGSNTVTVAVIDTGIIRPDHPDKPSRLYQGSNHVNPGQSVSDVLGHGTAVAGIIAARTNNGALMAGVNWNVGILAIKAAADDGSVDGLQIASAINEAVYDHPTLNVKVINLSASFYTQYSELEQAVRNAESKGITIVASSKNQDPGGGDRINCFMGLPAAYPFSNVVSVVAIDQNEQHFAGCTVGSVYPDLGGGHVHLSAPGKDIWSLNLSGGSEGGHNGSSFAAPHVSGVAAMVAACLPSNVPSNQSHLYVKEALMRGALNLGPLGWDSTYGYGLLNMFMSLNYNNYYQNCPAS